MHHTYRNLSGLSLRLGHAQPVFAGEEAEFPVILASGSGRPYRALGLGFAASPAAWCDVAAGLESIVRLKLPAPRRGRLRPPRICVATLYPLGLLRAWTWLAFEGECLVYPKPLAPPEFPAGGPGSETQRGQRELPGADDYAGLRRHVAGDSLRHVDWKAYARERGLYNKAFVEPTGSLQELDYEAFPGVEAELRLSYLCHLVLKAEREGTRYGLRLPGESIPAGLGAAHRERCLKALALFAGEGHHAGRTG
jgi:uncharacterized protein (DUF58 family)